MSTVAFHNVALHGHINPTLPVVAELVRRGHSVVYHTTPAFQSEVEGAGATVRLYAGGDQAPPDPPTPLGYLENLARIALRVLPAVLADHRHDQPDVIVHDAACPWGAIAAHELSVPAASSFTTFAFNQHVRSPTSASRDLLLAALAHPIHSGRYAQARLALGRRFNARQLPLLDLGDIHQPLNLVYTSREFQPAAEALDQSYRFVGPSTGARPTDSAFPMERLQDPVLYVSLGTVFKADPQLLRTFATALAPLGGTVVVSTGQTRPDALAPLPPNVVVRQTVPQVDLLRRAALFVTHGGMNSVNEAMYAGVPMLVVPQGADQPMVASRIAELGNGLAIRTQDVTEATVRARARELLHDEQYRSAAATMRIAQRKAGGSRRAVDELEDYLRATGRRTVGTRTNPGA